MERKQCCFPCSLSHFNSLHSLIDGLQQGPVLWVLVAVFVRKHVGQGVHIAVKVLLGQRLLLNTHKNTGQPWYVKLVDSKKTGTMFL